MSLFILMHRVWTASDIWRALRAHMRAHMRAQYMATDGAKQRRGLGGKEAGVRRGVQTRLRGGEVWSGVEWL